MLSFIHHLHQLGQILLHWHYKLKINTAGGWNIIRHSSFIVRTNLSYAYKAYNLSILYIRRLDDLSSRIVEACCQSVQEELR
jgi:hypothetical protein